MTNSNRTLGDSLARGLIRRWEREQKDLDLVGQLNGLPYIGNDEFPRQRLNKIAAAARSLQRRCPWVFGVTDYGRKKSREIRLATFVFEDGCGQVRLDSFSSQRSRTEVVQLRVSRHALQRMLQAGIRRPEDFSDALIGVTIALAQAGPAAGEIYARLEESNLVAIVRRESRTAAAVLVTVIPIDALDPKREADWQRWQQAQEVAA
jgi:hypothetical protein